MKNKWIASSDNLQRPVAEGRPFSGTTHHEDKTVVRPYYLYNGIPILEWWNIPTKKLATEYTSASSVNILLDKAQIHGIIRQHTETYCSRKTITAYYEDKTALRQCYLYEGIPILVTQNIINQIGCMHYITNIRGNILHYVDELNWKFQMGSVLYCTFPSNLGVIFKCIAEIVSKVIILGWVYIIGMVPWFYAKQIHIYPYH